MHQDTAKTELSTSLFRNDFLGSLVSAPAKPRAVVVIGANYGDEGKGAVVNALTKRLDSKDTVRFNGGPQALHTVQLKKGSHFGFRSLGSGTFQGAKTWLTEDVLVNPVFAYREQKEFQKKFGINVPYLMAHPDCMVITPWDMAINQFLEKGRGGDKHGSCGFGINETVNRYLNRADLRLSLDGLNNESATYRFVRGMNSWFKVRIINEKAKGTLDGLSEDDMETLNKLLIDQSPLFNKFYEYSLCAARSIFRTGPQGLRTTDPSYFQAPLVFEGAQGLLLDQNNKEHFPYLTRSNTGVQNAVKACGDWADITDVYYVTRPYLTRHGAGPMLAGQECENIWGKDRTNVENEYQDTIRYGHLDWTGLKERILEDLKHFGSNPPRVHIALTCMDQVEDREEYSLWTRGINQVHTGDNVVEKVVKSLEMFLGFHVESFNGLKG